MEWPANPAQIWRFGVFEVDGANAELRRGGRPVKIREQSLRILIFLLEHPGEIVTREALRTVLWPSDTFVDFDHSLNTAVMKLRDALSDSAETPLYIETIPKRGYRFIAPITMATTAPPPIAQVTSSGMRSGPLEAAAANSESAIDGPHTPGMEIGGAATTQRSPQNETGLKGKSDAEAPLPTFEAPAPALGFSRRGAIRGALIAGAIVATAGFLLLLVTVFAGLRHHVQHHSSQSAAYPVEYSSELLSVHGTMSAPMLSPDAREMAFLWNGENPWPDLYVQLIRGDREDEHPLRLTNTGGGSLCCQSWSPDGGELAYGRCDDAGGAVYAVSALGGPSRRIADVSCSYGTAGWPLWEAAGKSFIIIDTCTPGTAPTFMRITLATGKKHCIAKPVAGILGDTGAALSPDRNTIAFIRVISDTISDIYTLTPANGEIRRVTNEGKAISNLMWTPDGQQIVFRSARGGLPAVWRAPAKGGAIEKETLYPAVGSISADGRRLIYLTNPAATSYVPDAATAQIVRADLSAEGGKVLSSKDVIALGALSDGPQLSPDDSQIVFNSNAAGSSGIAGEIWKSLADGTDTTQLTILGTHSGTPRWSPDGHSIAFDTRPGAHSEIHAMDADGRNPRILIGGNADNVTPSWSHDGNFLYYASNRTGSYQIWKRDLSTGSERRLTQHGGLGPLESYDGKTLYYCIIDRGGLWAVSPTGENERRLLDAPHAGYWGYFAVAGSGVYLLDFTPKPTILYYDPERRKLTPILTMSEIPIFQEPGMGTSRSGKILLFAQGDTSSSITMVSFH